MLSILLYLNSAESEKQCMHQTFIPLLFHYRITVLQSSSTQKPKRKRSTKLNYFSDFLPPSTFNLHTGRPLPLIHFFLMGYAMFTRARPWSSCPSFYFRQVPFWRITMSHKFNNRAEQPWKYAPGWGILFFRLGSCVSCCFLHICDDYATVHHTACLVSFCNLVVL